MKIHGHKFHGDAKRFEVIVNLVEDKFGGKVRYVADVAGGQGMLARMLNKKGYEAEVIDPRGFALRGVAARNELYKSSMADYYDLIIGLHPDEAIKEVVESAPIRPVIVVPCCNFWDRTQKLGRDLLLESIEKYYINNAVKYERVELDFKSPHNFGLVSTPPNSL